MFAYLWSFIYKLSSVSKCTRFARQQLRIQGGKYVWAGSISDLIFPDFHGITFSPSGHLPYLQSKPGGSKCDRSLAETSAFIIVVIVTYK